MAKEKVDSKGEGYQRERNKKISLLKKNPRVYRVF
jgi:hypothetical protein